MIIREILISGSKKYTRWGPSLESSSYLNMTLRYLGPLDPGTMGPWDAGTLGLGLVWFGMIWFGIGG